MTEIVDDDENCKSGEKEFVSDTPFEFPLPGEAMPDPPTLANEPAAFQRIWTTDIAALTYDELCHLRANKWPDDLDPDDVSDDARTRWHLRIYAPTAAEIAENQ